MHSRLRRPAVALISTALAASVLGTAPAAHAAAWTISGTAPAPGGPVESVEVELYQYEADGEGGGFWYQTGDYASRTLTAILAHCSRGRLPRRLRRRLGTTPSSTTRTRTPWRRRDTVTVPSTATVQADAMLGAAAHVSGTVTDPNGVPVEDVIVAAYQVVGAGSDTDYRYVGFATTDGRFVRHRRAARRHLRRRLRGHLRRGVRDLRHRVLQRPAQQGRRRRADPRDGASRVPASTPSSSWTPPSPARSRTSTATPSTTATSRRRSRSAPMWQDVDYATSRGRHLHDRRAGCRHLPRALQR